MRCERGPGLRWRVERQEPKGLGTAERADDAEVPLVERSDVIRPDAGSEDDQRIIGDRL